jgi:hypothetical protein
MCGLRFCLDLLTWLDGHMANDAGISPTTLGRGVRDASHGRIYRDAVE